MKWMQGYIMLCSVCAVILTKDLVRLSPRVILIVPSISVWCVLISYIVCLALLGAILPGKVYPGVRLRDGSVIHYKCNGLYVTLTFVSLMTVMLWRDYIDGAWVADHVNELFVAANFFAIALSVTLFVTGRVSRRPNWIRKRSILRDFIMGAELNPFLFGLNVKFFSYRPAMAGWMLVNLSFLCKQYKTLGLITSRMYLYQLTTAWYILDYFVHEPKMLFTWDIIAEHFGFMLVWGDYVFIVFFFSLQNMFLLDDVRPISYTWIIITTIVFFAGFVIFRGANSQKHKFKTDPSAYIWGKPPVTIGGKLLVSGFWGFARHMNYTGDLLVALSFSLPCGFQSSLPYFYFVYLLILTVHREKRDDDRCSQKYRSLWDQYCTRVPNHMVPYVY